MSNWKLNAKILLLLFRFALINEFVCESFYFCLYEISINVNFATLSKKNCMKTCQMSKLLNECLPTSDYIPQTIDSINALQ